jgi:uncharacterized protein (TIGR02231 family)
MARPALLLAALAAAPAAAFAAPGAASAAEIELASRIDRVTVFPDAALVTRAAEAALPAGASTLVLRGLPADVDPASVRVEGEGAFAVGSVDLRAVPGEALPAADPALEARLRALRDERERLAVRIEAAEGRKAAVERFGQVGPERLGPDGRFLEVAQWPGAWEAIGAGLAAAGEDLRALNAAARDLDARIEALEQARPPAPGGPKRDVAVMVEADAAGPARLAVSYRVAGASWTPVYDARLDTGTRERPPALALTRRARVVQRTGEDWGEVQLTVSTVRVARGTAAPELPPLQVDFAPPPAPPPPAPKAFEAAEVPRRAAPMAQAMRARAVETEAALEASPFQAAYAVPGRVAVPADGTAKSLVLSSAQPKPTLAVTAAPALDETAYLTAAFVNEGAAALLPGEVALNRDGVFVGRARLKAAAPGEAVELGFGADDAVKVTRVPVRRQASEPGFLGQTRSDEREFRTTVRNGHAGPIRVTILDRVPYSESGQITVELLPATTAASQAQVGDRRGVMAWSADYAPGETRAFTLAYRLRWPSDREVVTTPRPVRPDPRS